jgi:deoxycytidylate deaminase
MEAMRLLSGKERGDALAFMQKAAEIAKGSCCMRSKCGSIIVKDGRIIGSGFNSPPGNKCLKSCIKDSLPRDFKSDRTCCVHAEQRAMVDALRRNPKTIQGSRIYFIRLDEKGNMEPAGKPYCTICSKMALDVGISEFALMHKEGICVYDTENYNDASFGR